MRKKLINKLKAQDQFGKQVQLNLNQKPGSFKSLPGGIFSIILRIFYFYLTFTKFYEMFLYLDDQIQNYNTLTDFKKLGALEIDSLGSTPIYIIDYKGG